MMELVTVFAIAVALAMDCFAVSLAAGMVIKERRLFSATIMGIFFGTFQAVMAITGWAAGIRIAEITGFIDHWIAFVILAIVGGKMIFEGLHGEEYPDRNYLSVSLLLILSIATSIDSFGVGLSLALLSISILSAAAIIGCISYIFSFSGVMLGSRLSAWFGSPVEIAGGLLLILIGFRILFEHLGS